MVSGRAQEPRRMDLRAAEVPHGAQWHPKRSVSIKINLNKSKMYV